MFFDIKKQKQQHFSFRDAVAAFILKVREEDKNGACQTKLGFLEVNPF